MAERTRKVQNKRPSSWKRRLFWGTLKWGAVSAIWCGFALLLFLGWCAYDLPDVSGLNDIKRQPSITLLAADGSLIASYGDLYGEFVHLNEMSGYLPAAVLSTEDRRFYHHYGIDPIGLLRAAFVNLRSGGLVQGGSTITQQLAKNVFLTPERSLHRKGQELLLSFWLEHHFTKNQILELYLNRVYFGSGTYGVDAAARRYFGKSAKDVSLLQAAMLAGMLKAPSRYNPLNDPIASATRAQLVIDNMVSAGFITEAQANQAGTESADAADNTPMPPGGRYFSDWALDQVSSYISYTNADLVVQTTLDPRAQSFAERDLAQVIAKEGPAQNASEAALVSLTPDGAVRAMVGGLDYKQSQYNRATQAMRQPGSSFKAFVYLTAFEQGLTPEAQFVDTPISIGNWRPGNYNDKYYGNVTLREAFARSLNSVAVQLSERAGRSNVIATAKRLGIDTPLGNDASIALGTSETTVLEMTAAYATFANRGEGVLPYGITRIATRDGKVLYQRSGGGLGTVASPVAVREMLDVMSATVDWGTGKHAQIDRPAAGKTGTSQNYHDAWFIGLTAQLVTGVWVGNDDNQPMNKVTGGSLPVDIWHDYMLEALAGTPPQPIPLPAGAGGMIAAGEPAPLPATATASADEPGLLDRLVQSILGGGSETDSGSVSSGGSTNRVKPPKPERTTK
ncbi:MAG TPA: PBP1A family penicillin-binding protein [Candidatus Cybelea sp.]|nr:PBP1A family penicillin-binding protein [Candidatus Cybelea sp.]